MITDSKKFQERIQLFFPSMLDKVDMYEVHKFITTHTSVEVNNICGMDVLQRGKSGI